MKNFHTPRRICESNTEIKRRAQRKNIFIAKSNNQNKEKLLPFAAEFVLELHKIKKYKRETI